jgi:signal transduction histidine kinase
VTIATITLCGWLAAALAAVGVVIARRSFEFRMEAVARACHELRGPLTAARLGLELGVRGGELSPAQLRALDLELARAALALDDLAAAGAPVREERAEEMVEISDLLADSVEAWRPAAVAAGAVLELEWFRAPVHVIGDRLRIAQATGNLIANAIEHGGGAITVRGGVVAGRGGVVAGRGGVVAGWDGLVAGRGGVVAGRGGTIDARGQAETASVRVEVLDGGPGLPAPVAELTRRRRAGVEGRGRGLAIAQSIARDLGGSLAAAPCDHGARLVLELPIAAASQAPEPTPAAHRAGRSAERLSGDRDRGSSVSGGLGVKG